VEVVLGALVVEVDRGKVVDVRAGPAAVVVQPARNTIVAETTSNP
jgi:hypothetical protein